MKPPPDTWTTRTGQSIRIQEMTDAHLRHTIRFLYRQAEHAMALLPYPYFQGEQAQAQALSEWERIQSGDINERDIEEMAAFIAPIYPALVKEAERRGLVP